MRMDTHVYEHICVGYNVGGITCVGLRAYEHMCMDAVSPFHPYLDRRRSLNLTHHRGRRPRPCVEVRDFDARVAQAAGQLLPLGLKLPAV
jgi:hypothetical protein